MPDFGEGLKREREKKGISLEEVAHATKISTRMLRAIEEEQFEKLPGGIFNKGFIRAYAIHLGMDDRKVLAAYLEVLRANEPQPEITPEHVEEEVAAGEKVRRSVRIPWGALAAALLIGTLGLALWATRSKDSSTNETTPPAPVPETSASTAVTARPKANVVDNSGVRVREQAAGEVSAASATTKVDPEEVESITVAVDPSSGVLPGGAFQVRIHANEDSWLQITADGQSVMEDVLAAEKIKLVAAQKELVIKAGNVGGLEFWFNGSKLPHQGDLDEVKTLTFAKTGLVTSAARIETLGTQLSR